ncbi:MAG TPA: phage holin family protein [Verrucomicrobiae bacterium]|nr:phage holin family protein [Verrucomicrobiae bacterium]
MSTQTENKSLSELLSDAANNLNALVRNEVRLARAEFAAKVSRAAVGLAILVAGVAMIGAAMVLVLLALAGWLVEMGLSQPAAYLIAGLSGAAIGACLARIAVSRLKADGIAPTRTIEQLHRDALVAKEMVR